MVRVLFVCRANICRSPMAEAMLNALAQDAGIELRAESAGVAALKGEAMDPSARAVLEEIGIFAGDHHARQVTPALVADVDLVLTMSGRQRAELLRSYGASPDVVHTLPAYANGTPGRDGVVDPHGQSMQTYRVTSREILGYVGPLLDAAPAKTAPVGTPEG